MYLASRSPQRKALLEALGIGFEIVLPDYDELDEWGLLPAQQVEEHSRGKSLSVVDRITPLEPGRPVLGVDTLVYAGGRALGKAHDETTAREYLSHMSGKIHVVYSGITLVSVADTPDDTWQSFTDPGHLPFSHPERSEGTRPGGDCGNGAGGMAPGDHSSLPHGRTAEDESHPGRSEGSRSGSNEISSSGEDEYDLMPFSGEIEEIAGQPVLVDTRHATTEVQFSRLSAAEIDAYIGTGEWRERAGAYAIQGCASAFVEEVRGDYTNVVGLPVPLLVEMLRNIGLWPPAAWANG